METDITHKYVHFITAEYRDNYDNLTRHCTCFYSDNPIPYTSDAAKVIIKECKDNMPDKRPIYITSLATFLNA